MSRAVTRGHDPAALVGRWRGGLPGFLTFVADAKLQVLERGRWTPFTLWPWQTSFLEQLFALPEFPRTILLVLPRRSGKTALAAALTLWAAFTRANAVVGAGANSEAQAAAVPYRMVKQMLLRSKLLLELIGGADSVGEQRIALPALGSEIRPLPNAPASALGIGFTVAWVSELGEGEPGLFQALAGGILDRPVGDSFVIVDSTPSGPEHLLAALHRSAANQGGPDSTVFSYWRSWRPGQPTLNPHLRERDLEARRRQLLPSEFARLHCAEWVGGTSGLLTPEVIAACEVPEVPTVEALHERFKRVFFSCGGDFALAGSAHGDRSWLVTIAACSDRRAGPEDDEAELHVLRCTEVPRDEDRRAELDAIVGQIGRNPDMVTLEQYQAGAFREYLERVHVPVTLAHASRGEQALAWTRLHSLATSNRLHIPVKFKVLFQQLALMEVDSSGTVPTFQARGKGRGDARDDAAYSLAWAIHATASWSHRTRPTPPPVRRNSGKFLRPDSATELLQQLRAIGGRRL